jgi:AraC-like DNA-binding protein
MVLNSNLILTGFVIFQLLLFIVFLLTGKQRQRTSNKILIVLLFSQVLWYFESSLFHWGSAIILYFLHFLYIGESLSFIWGPGVFLYIQYLIRGDRKFEPKDLLYFSFVIVHFGFMAYKYHFKAADVKRHIITSGQLFSYAEIVVSWSLYCINNIGFTVAAFLSFHRFKKRVKNAMVPSGNINIKLINLVLIGFLSIVINESLRYFAFLLGKYSLNLPLYTFTLIDTYIFISILIVAILKRPGLFHKQKESVKYTSSPLTHSDIILFSDRLREYLRYEKPYLNDVLCLEDLAKALNIAPRYLSQVINQAFNQNFSDYINGYRISHALKMLSDKKSNKTISEIFYCSGFNSRASFYKAFKKQMNTTPSEYRQLLTSGLN